MPGLFDKPTTGNSTYGQSGTDPGLSDIVIADRLSDRNQVRIRGTTGLQVSWELSRAGQLTCDIPLRDLAGYGFRPSDLLAKWLHYDHPTAGHWGGQITNISPHDGIVTINAESWAIMYKGLLAQSAGNESGSLIGKLAMQIDALRAFSGITLGFVDTGGSNPLVEADFIALNEDMYDAFLPKVLDRWNEVNGWQQGLQAAGWNVDPLTRQFNFDATYGRDLSNTVTLRDGLHTTGAEWSDDMNDIVNFVVIKAAYNTSWTETVWYTNDKGKQRQTTVTYYGTQQDTRSGLDVSSANRYGLRQIYVDDTGTTYANAAMIQNAATQRARMLASNQQLVTIDCADVGQVWRLFREGDIIMAALPNEDAQGRMVVRHRSLDVSRGVMTISGEAELF